MVIPELVALLQGVPELYNPARSMFCGASTRSSQEISTCLHERSDSSQLGTPSWTGFRPIPLTLGETRSGPAGPARSATVAGRWPAERGGLWGRRGGRGRPGDRKPSGGRQRNARHGDSFGHGRLLVRSSSTISGPVPLSSPRSAVGVVVGGAPASAMLPAHLNGHRVTGGRFRGQVGLLFRSSSVALGFGDLDCAVGAWGEIPGARTSDGAARWPVYDAEDCPALPQRRAVGGAGTPAERLQEYTFNHLVRLLWIRWLVGLGMPLARIAAMDESDEAVAKLFRTIDDQLAACIERQRDARRNLPRSCGIVPMD